jgi:hypothetical protein
MFFLNTTAGAGPNELAMSGTSDMVALRAPLQVVNLGRPASRLIAASDVLSGKWARAALPALLTLLLIGLFAGARWHVSAVPAISADDPHFEPAWRFSMSLCSVAGIKPSAPERNVGKPDPGFRRLI